MSQWLWTTLLLMPLTAADAQSSGGQQWFSAWTGAQDGIVSGQAAGQAVGLASMNGTSVRMIVRLTISGGAIRGIL